jgi:sugar phosphate isomerase/epimerase
MSNRLSLSVLNSGIKFYNLDRYLPLLQEITKPIELNFEISPTYFFENDWKSLNLNDFKILSQKGNDENFRITSFQSILFNLGQTVVKHDRNLVRDHFKKLVEFGSVLDIEYLVFGSPSFRTSSENKIYIEFFEFVSDIFDGTRIELRIENNSKYTGAIGLNSPYLINKILDETGLDYLGFHFDTCSGFKDRIQKETVSFFKSMHISIDAELNFENQEYISYLKNIVSNLNSSVTIGFEFLTSCRSPEGSIKEFEKFVDFVKRAK